MQELINILVPEKTPPHILRLKTLISDKMEQEGVNRFVGEDETFGFKERFVNILMHYAYEAGKQSSK
jgi:hypothetical protein